MTYKLSVFIMTLLFSHQYISVTKFLNRGSKRKKPIPFMKSLQQLLKCEIWAIKPKTSKKWTLMTIISITSKCEQRLL